MSKGRLEQIKDKVSLLRNSSELQPHEFIIDVLHLDWLIQQAERAQNLETDYKSFRKLVDGYAELEQQNKRYREALEFYSKRDNYESKHFDPNIVEYMSTIDYDEGKEARQALESESSE